MKAEIPMSPHLHRLRQVARQQVREPLWSVPQVRHGSSEGRDARVPAGARPRVAERGADDRERAGVCVRGSGQRGGGMSGLTDILREALRTPRGTRGTIWQPTCDATVLERITPTASGARWHCPSHTRRRRAV
jgi:hypothetical protein